MKGFVAIAAAALVLVPGASAKAPPSGFRVCGTTACRAIDGNDAELLAINMFYTSNRTLDAAPPAATFYAVHWRWNATAREQTGYFVPSANAVYLYADPGTRTSAGWYVLNDPARAALARVVSPLEPFAEPTIVRVTVAGKQVSDPSTYGWLWSIGKRVFDYPTSAWLRVRIFTSPRSPWHGSVLIARRGNLMSRDDTVYAIPARVAARIRARLALR